MCDGSSELTTLNSNNSVSRNIEKVLATGYVICMPRGSPLYYIGVDSISVLSAKLLALLGRRLAMP